jgi:hypothetical protein
VIVPPMRTLLESGRVRGDGHGTPRSTLAAG